MFTQTAKRLGNRRGEEVSRLRVCCSNFLLRKRKKPRIRFQASTTAESSRKRGKDGNRTSVALNFDEGIKRPRQKSQVRQKRERKA